MVHKWLTPQQPRASASTTTYDDVADVLIVELHRIPAGDQIVHDDTPERVSDNRDTAARRFEVWRPLAEHAVETV